MTKDVDVYKRQVYNIFVIFPSTAVYDVKENYVWCIHEETIFVHTSAGSGLLI